MFIVHETGIQQAPEERNVAPTLRSSEAKLGEFVLVL